MKKIIMFSSLVFLMTNCFTQNDLKLIIKKDKELVEKYYVLKNNRKIKHGEYQKILNEKLIEKGQYDSNNKSGIWTYFDREGELELKYNYDNEQVIINNQIENIDSLDRPVIYLGSTYEYRWLIQTTLRYPPDAAENGIDGKIIISIMVNKEGEIYDYYVKQIVYPSLDNEALRVVKLINGEWLPAKDKGICIESNYDIPVVFKLL